MDGEDHFPLGLQERTAEELDERLQVVDVNDVRPPGVHFSCRALAAAREEHARLVMRMRGHLAADVLHAATNGIPVNQIGTPHRPEPPS